MSLNFGREQLSIPGPSVIPERVLTAMHRPAPNIYTGELLDISDTIFTDLKTISGSAQHMALYIANGHGAWEAALCNACSRGDKILVLATGRFAIGWSEMANALGIDAEIIDFGTESDADAAVLEGRLREDKNRQIKAILVTQTDTASSVSNDIAELRLAIDRAEHPALFMVDAIASLGCEPFFMQDWRVDVMVSACQKGLMTPPGLSFVFYNDRAVMAQKKSDLVTPYWNWHSRSNATEFYQNFCGTAPTHHLYGLRKALDILLHEEGLEAAWARHKTFAKSVAAAIDAWGQGGELRMNIADPAKRSLSVTTVYTGAGDAGRLRDWTEHMAGVTLGIGLGLEQLEPGQESSVFRIGHMGHLNIPMIMGALGAIDAGLKALHIPHGPGALEAATGVLAQHPA